MADVFISYKREDKPAVQRLVEAVRAAGVTLWWDQDIAPDAPWEATIERELAEAKCVIVAWSAASVASENVKAEAREARQAGKLLQVFVEACKPPLFFGERQGVDLSAWNGDPADRRFVTVLAAVQAVIAGKKPPEGVGYAPKKRAPVALITGGLAALASLTTIAANIGGARDGLCGIGGLHDACLQAGLVSAPMPSVPAPVAPTAAEVAAQTRAAELAKVAGEWGNGPGSGPACQFKLRYAVEHRGGEDYIVIDKDGPNFSEGIVTTAEPGKLHTRTTLPEKDKARPWDIEFDADQLKQTDANGVSTTLVRCGD